jgi:hypothetical protein
VIGVLFNHAIKRRIIDINPVTHAKTGCNERSAVTGHRQSKMAVQHNSFLTSAHQSRFSNSSFMLLIFERQYAANGVVPRNISANHTTAQQRLFTAASCLFTGLNHNAIWLYASHSCEPMKSPQFLTRDEAGEVQVMRTTTRSGHSVDILESCA